MQAKQPQEGKSALALQIRSVQEIPELYTNTRVKDPLAFVRFQASWMNMSWYVFEWNGRDKFFGMKANEKTGERSYGLFSLEDLSGLRGPFEARVVQDYSFQPIPLSQVRQRVLGRALGVER